MTIGERIKMAREARGMTKKELAKRIGATEEAIRIFESDRVCPGEYTLKNIAYTMQMDVNVLRGNPGDQTAKREIAGEYSAEFDRLRQARVNVSFYKYGPARKNFGEGRVDALATAQRCLCGHNVHQWVSGPKGWAVYCKHCGLESPWAKKSHSAVIEAWNTTILEKRKEQRYEHDSQ